MKLKKLLASVLVGASVLAVAPIGIAASSSTNGKTLNFNLTSDGENEVIKETGEIVSVTLSIEGDADYKISTASDYIIYDGDFFQLVDEEPVINEAFYDNLGNSSVDYSNSVDFWGNYHYTVSMMHEGVSKTYKKDQEIITFKLKVIGTTDSSVITTTTRTANDESLKAYNTTCTDLKVIVGTPIPTYTLSFDSMGGNSIPDVVKNAGTELNVEQYKTTRTGYIFDGWYLTDDYEGEKVTSLTLNADTTLYAKWKLPEAKKYTLSFVTNGGALLDSVTEDVNTVIRLNQYTTIRDGYDFKGWYSDPELTERVTSITLTKDTIVYAKWEKEQEDEGGNGGYVPVRKYMLTFITNGGSKVSAVVLEKDTRINLSEYITRREGYEFEGWYLDSKLTEKVTYVKLTKNTVVYAKWKKIDTTTPVDPVTPTIPYKDITTATPHYSSIMYVTENKIMNGTGDGTTFSPTMPITRGMIVTMLWRLEGTPVVANPALFPDTPEWCRDAIAWGNSVGIIKGYDNGLSGANDNINNEQLQLMLLRYATLKGYNVDAAGDDYLFYCTDYTDISTWALAGVKWSVANGIVTGDVLGKVYPKAFPTRAETAAYLHRFMTNVKPAAVVAP